MNKNKNKKAREERNRGFMAMGLCCVVLCGREAAEGRLYIGEEVMGSVVVMYSI